LVVTPDANFYVLPEHAICTLDFASLYPSIIDGYRICYMRVVYDRAYLTDPRAKLQYIPLDADTCAVFVLEYDGVPVESITDKIVSEITNNRKQIRTAMKTVLDPFLLDSLDAAQLSAKVLQNGSYGFLGSPTSGMLCTALAAAVTAIGQYMNKTVRHLALSKHGARCVGGDTDSTFLQFPTQGTTEDEIYSEIYQHARAVEREATLLFPPPNAQEFEVCKSPCLLTAKKKTYACFELPPTSTGWAQPRPALCVKGFSFKKRDRCDYVQTVGHQQLHALLSRKSDSELLELLKVCLSAFNPAPVSKEEVLPYIITTALSPEYKNTEALALRLSSLIEAESGNRPLPGSRLPYLVLHHDAAGLKHADRIVTVSGFLSRPGSRLDTSYYLLNQLTKSLLQIYSLPVHEQLSTRVRRTIADWVGRLENMRMGQPLLSTQFAGNGL
jgi:DNA polymerase delta subunit 1